MIGLLTSLGLAIRDFVIGWLFSQLVIQAKRLVDKYSQKYNISPHAKNIASAFNYYSASQIQKPSMAIDKLGHIKRKEIQEIQIAWDGGIDGLLLVGDAGSGKSGIVLDLAKDLRTKGTPCLIINAKELPLDQDPAQFINERLSISDGVSEAFHSLGQEKKCILIVDQIDNLVGAETLKAVITLMKVIASYEGVRVLGSVRTYEANNDETVKLLDFREITSHLPNKKTVQGYLEQLGISDPSDDLLELARNLLNLSIIADVVSHEEIPLELTKQINLWEKYINSIAEREGRDVLDYALQLACTDLEADKPDFTVPIALLSKAERLISRGIIIEVSFRRYRFRHEQLRDFFVAYSLFLERLNVRSIISRFDKFQSRNVLLWLHDLYKNKSRNELANFLREIFYEESIPFYTKITILSFYLGDIYQFDQSEIDVIANFLREKDNFLNAFLRSSPDHTWVRVFWQKGFFDDPPSPEKVSEDEVALPYWFVQGFLIDVANEEPEIILKHINTIDANGWYISQAIRALNRMDPTEAVKAVETINQWLNASEIAGAIREEVYEYLIILIAGEFIDEALSVFYELTKPRVVKDYKLIGRQRVAHEPVFTIYHHIITKDHHRINTHFELSKRYPNDVYSILFDHLGEALKLEGQIQNRPDFDKSSWWRVAVEPTGQDPRNTTKDNLLKLLLQTLEQWADNDFTNFQSVLNDLLEDERSIFYRIGLYLLQKYANKLPLLATKEIRKYKNLDNTELRHEYFLLLENGFQFLSTKEQNNLVEYILAGPPKETREKIKSLYSSSTIMKLSKEEYLSGRCDVWLRDRLWMIRNNLMDEAKDKLAELLEKYDQPEHPTFHSWTSGGGFVRQVSPIQGEELSEFTPEQLIEFIRNWKPVSDSISLLEEENYEGLGQEVANAIYNNTAYYQQSLSDIAKTRPVIANEILDQFFYSEGMTPDQWEIIISLFENLLEDDDIRTSLKSGYGGTWKWVRLSLARLLRLGFEKDSHYIQEYLWSRARDILLILIDDLDPDTEPRPEIDKDFGVNDPLTVALNRIRPIAVDTLIKYAVFRAKKLKTGTRMEEEVQQALLKKLDLSQDTSLSVRSMFGKHLPKLHWLDEAWFDKNIDKILPQITDIESVWLFQSAWDSYIYHWKYILDFKKLLYTKYITAIDTLSYGIVTRRDIIANLANHLVIDFLLGDYGEDYLDNELVPVIRFFKKTRAEDRAFGADACWRVCKHHPDKLREWWPKIKDIWEWRVKEAISENNSNDFDPEMRNFANLPGVAPDDETILTLKPLMEAMLPHISNIRYRDRGWDAFEKYLAEQVDKYPKECIQLYRRMRELRGEISLWRRETDEATKIMETAAENPSSRSETLTLIDYLLSLGNEAFNYIYDRYAK